MRNRILVAAGAAFAIGLVAPRTARACGRGANYSGAYAGLAVVGLGGLLLFGGDVALTVRDLGELSGSGPPSAGYGVAEMLLAGPQVALGVAAMSSTSSNGAFAVYTIWMSALTLHGIWTIARAASAASAPALPPAPDPPDDASPSHLQLRVGATYVPLGELARPGVGLVGRF